MWFRNRNTIYNHKFIISGFCFLMIFIFSCENREIHELGKRKVVLVILDGIPAEILEQIPTPNLDEIIQNGDYRRT